MDGATFRACPNPNLERQLGQAMTAIATGLASRSPAIHDDRFSPVPLGLVLDLPPELTHAHVRYSAGQVAVLDHAGNIQVF